MANILQTKYSDILNEISLKFVPKGPIDTNPALL